MAEGLNLHKKHIINYDESGWFNGNVFDFTNILRELGVNFWQNEDGTEIEIDRESLKGGIVTLKAIDKGNVDDVDVDYIAEMLDNESMTLAELIVCFEWLRDKSDQSHDKIYVSYF